MDGSLGKGRGLGCIRFQEAEQRFDSAAATIAEFLLDGAGRVVDTSTSPDDTRVISIIGYVVSRRASETDTREVRHG